MMPRYEVELMTTVYAKRYIEVEAESEEEAAEKALHDNQVDWEIDGPCPVAGDVSHGEIRLLDSDDDKEKE